MDTTVTEKNYPIRLEWVLKFFGLVVLIGLSLIFLSRIGVNLGPGPDPRLLTLLLVIAGVVPVTNALLSGTPRLPALLDLHRPPASALPGPARPGARGRPREAVRTDRRRVSERSAQPARVRAPRRPRRCRP